MLLFTICRVYASKWLRPVLLFHFLLIVGIKGEKGSLAHDKTWFGRRFCCLVIYANLHNLPFICVSLGIKVKKRNLRTCQNMAWKAFLLFGDLC